METLGNTKHSSPRAVLYCCTASSNPCGNGAIISQRDRLRDYAKKQGFEITAEYFDNGFNGLTLDRPAFTMMESAINAGEVDMVLVHSITRIARNFLLAGKWLQELNGRGVRLISLDGIQVPFPAVPNTAKLVLNQKRGQRFSNKQ